MNIEHFGLNVSDPDGFVDWYVANLDMKLVRKVDDPAKTRFIADSAGKTLIEIYCNPTAKVPDHKEIHPLEMHICFNSDDVKGTVERLVKAGATIFDAPFFVGSDELAMLKDPWGLSFQISKRGEPMI